MIRIEVRHLFDVPVHDAFAFITDLENWPLYWPDFVRIEDAEHARCWAAPGDRVTVVQRLIGRTVALHMELVEHRADELVRYRSRQDGLPDVDHERHFLAVPNGTHYRLVVSYAPRAGLRGLFDRVVLRRGVKRALRATIENLRVALRGASGGVTATDG